MLIYVEERSMNSRLLKNKNILVTGAAGFIGSNLVKKILEESMECCVVGVDNLNDYYDPELKKYRLDELEKAAKTSLSNWEFIMGDISDKSFVSDLFEKYSFAIVINLAAQAGVRYSIENPDVYIQSNIIGFYNILESCRKMCAQPDRGFQHLVYASSSSVYGGNTKVPFHIHDKVDTPVSLYAATKKTDELLAHAYSKLYDIPTTGLRFFTVYGPAGRPDMAYFGFTNKLRSEQMIEIFNYGNCKRDFTYIDDVVEGVMKVLVKAPLQNQGEDGLPIPPYKIYNIGNGHPESLLDFVDILQQELVEIGVLREDFNFEQYKKLVPMQPGDVPVTYADTTELESDFGYKPNTDLRTGIHKFACWYKNYYIK